MGCIIVTEATSAQFTAISRIIDSYSLDALKPAVQRSPEALRVRIGFVGEFSSGKSTLINAIIGTKVLPSRDTPTTANIVQIEAVPGTQQPQRLAKGADGSERVIDQAEFDAIARGMASGTLTLHVPPSELLQPGIQLIDSPGINSLMAGHAELTIAQLSLLDGLVICLHPEIGTVPATIQKFLQRPEIQSISDKLLFVLTCTDQKSPHSIQKISDHIASAIAGIFPPSLGTPAIIPVQALDALEHQSDGMARFAQAFKAAFVTRAEALRADRHAIHARELAAQVRAGVRAYLDAVSYDDAGIASKLAEAGTQIAQLEKARSGEMERLDTWYRDLGRDLLTVSNQFAPALARSTGADMEAVLTQLELALQDTAGKHLKTYTAGASVVLQGLPPGPRIALASALLAHAKYVEHGVTIVTTAAVAAATAGFGAGAALTAEAAAGAATGKTLAAGAAKAVVGKVVAKEVANSVGKLVMQQLAKAVVEMNPAEMAGDVVRAMWNESDTSIYLPQIAAQLAAAYRADMARHLEEQCFGPLEQELLVAQQAMREARASRTAAIDTLGARKEAAMNDLRALDAIIASGPGAR